MRAIGLVEFVERRQGTLRGNGKDRTVAVATFRGSPIESSAGGLQELAVRARAVNCVEAV